MQKNHPSKFPLSSGDLKFVLTSDLNVLTNIPNGVIIAFQLKSKIKREQIVQALQKIDDLFPLLKLKTTFNPSDLSWQVTDQSAELFFSERVIVLENLIGNFEEFLSQSNNSLRKK